jgi:hypothetical protein
MKKLCVLIPIVIVALTGCIGIDTDISINEGGDGTVSLSYQVSQKVVRMGTLEEEVPLVPLPVNEDDFRDMAATIPDLTLTSIERSEDAEHVSITAECSFASLEALGELFSRDEEQFTITETEDSTVLQYTLYTQTEEPIDEDTLTMIDTFFSDYTINFTINTPEEITNASVGTLSDNQQRLNYTAAIPQLFRNNQTVTIQVEW